ncbi:MAG TPA: metal-dependent hydrolase [Deltaproteobacteria bacterium]|jgi:membrane-bound metal-dependent hydrolase YbcI (DUF457 family)|nr:metal-dependent hydrolase [Deltaproteobacteria bacterium]HQI01032.1 metal-dependent hydrolase [Deltaproteobacteria bacterium]HQJ09139.1 metal-dependent hydrolase [Deltaproteobacteria bacterium]
MTPAGHASAAYLAGLSIPWLSMSALVTGALLPDIDYVFYSYPWFSGIHRVLTHNVFFILAVSLPALLFAGPRTKGRVFVSLLLGGMIHLLTDACFDSNPRNGIGAAILWPLSNAFFSPFNLLDPRITSAWWPDIFPRSMDALVRIAWDLPFVIAAGAIFIKRRKEAVTRST